MIRTYQYRVKDSACSKTWSRAALAKTKMAKSVLDAGWSSFRNMLKFKAAAHGAIVVEVNEAFSTVTCSCCDSRTGPEGVAGLRIREWTCSACGQQHDRDTNAAKNILRLGHETLAAGIPSFPRKRQPQAEVGENVNYTSLHANYLL